MALYDLKDVASIIMAGRYELATTKCRQEVLGLGLTEDSAARLVRMLTEGDYTGVFRGCSHDLGDDIDADVYLAWFDVDGLARCDALDGKHLYIKLAIQERAGYPERCLLISFHESIYPS